VIHDAVLAACDDADGLHDGLISEPRQCKFDPKVLACKTEDNSTCLTGPQVEAARKIMGSARNPRTGTELFPGMMPGTELAWQVLAGGPEPSANAVTLFKYVVFNNPDWNWQTFDFDHDVATSDKVELIQPLDPNLREFARHGKLILYHGWADGNVAPLSTVNYYNSVTRILGGASNVVRLFMSPGMAHCGGGEGPNSFDAVSALEQWVEHGKAPDQIIASHRGADGKVDRTRPLCPYPQIARYKGTGSIDDAANFVCKAP